MTRISSYSLWLGHAGDGRDYPAAHREGIRALVQLAAEEPPDSPPRDFLYSRFPIMDGHANDCDVLILAVNFVADLLRLEVPTLLYCSAGLSRSPALAAVALALHTDRGLDACLRKVAQCRRVDVSPGLWSYLHEVFDVILGC
jgi:protein-tyrosine phosphatase